jgi:hypothetical protein
MTLAGNGGESRRFGNNLLIVLTQTTSVQFRE